MKLTRGFEQAVCVITLLATQEDNIPVSAIIIHHRLNGSQTYMRKIMRKLVVAHLVTSVPGNMGGFALAKQPKEISLLEVVTALEGQIQSYPDTGLIDQVFKDFKPLADAGTQVVNKAFTEADKLWSNYLATQHVDQLILSTLGTNEIPKLNWNESDEQRELLIQKLIKNFK